MQMISQGGGDMWQEATPGTCVPCLPGEIEPWAECLWVWRNYRLGGRLTCLWHQRRQPRQRWRKPAVVIVHKLRRHVFEEFMRWLYCTHGGISPRGVSCPEHTTTTHRGRVGSCVCPLKHDRVRPASVSSVLHQELDLSPWTDNVRRGRVYLSGIPRAAAIPPSFSLPRWWISHVSLDRDISFSTDCFLSLLVTLSLAKLLCFFASGLVLSFFLIGGSKFQNDERLSCDLKRGQLVQDGIIDD